MKGILFLLLIAYIFMPNLSQARAGRLEPIMYNVVSDKKDKTIKKDHFILFGTVKMFSSLNPLDNVLVGCTSSGLWVRSDADGKFEIELKASDSVVYFYKEGWSEILMDDYEFKDQHRIEVDASMYQAANDVKRKPVIYLYNETALDVNIKLDPKGEFTFTYPEYNDEWNVKIDDSGSLNVDGREYPYLFWEAESQGMKYMTENEKLPGFIIESKDVVSFFEDKLDQIGLNQTEKTDFITYWGPILSHKEYAFIQFVVDDNYDELICGLDIEPKPNSSKRIFIQCCGLDDENIGIDLVEQNFTSFERTGFTLVEWGGAVLDLNKLTP